MDGTRYPIANDKRYSIALEYCGYVKRRWIVRFCGGWIGRGINRADAEKIAQQHHAMRMLALMLT
jgi:hypothetical protein